MKILLLNKHPVISKLVRLSAQKLEYEFDEQARYEDTLPLYDVIVVDDSVSADLKDLQNKCKKLICINSGETNLQANPKILHKPFLPTDLIALMREDTKPAAQDEQQDEINAQEAQTIDDTPLDLDSLSFDMPETSSQEASSPSADTEKAEPSNETDDTNIYLQDIKEDSLTPESANSDENLSASGLNFENSADNANLGSEIATDTSIEKTNALDNMNLSAMSEDIGGTNTENSADFNTNELNLGDLNLDFPSTNTTSLETEQANGDFNTPNLNKTASENVAENSAQTQETTPQEPKDELSIEPIEFVEMPLPTLESTTNSAQSTEQASTQDENAKKSEETNDELAFDSKDIADIMGLNEQESPNKDTTQASENANEGANGDKSFDLELSKAHFLQPLNESYEEIVAKNSAEQNANDEVAQDNQAQENLTLPQENTDEQNVKLPSSETTESANQSIKDTTRDENIMQDAGISSELSQNSDFISESDLNAEPTTSQNEAQSEQIPSKNSTQSEIPSESADEDTLQDESNLTQKTQDLGISQENADEGEPSAQQSEDLSENTENSAKQAESADENLGINESQSVGAGANENADESASESIKADEGAKVDDSTNSSENLNTDEANATNTKADENIDESEDKSASTDESESPLDLDLSNADFLQPLSQEPFSIEEKEEEKISFDDLPENAKFLGQKDEDSVEADEIRPILVDEPKVQSTQDMVKEQLADLNAMDEALNQSPENFAQTPSETNFDENLAQVPQSNAPSSENALNADLTDDLQGLSEEELQRALGEIPAQESTSQTKTNANQASNASAQNGENSSPSELMDELSRGISGAITSSIKDDALKAALKGMNMHIDINIKFDEDKA